MRKGGVINHHRYQNSVNILRALICVWALCSSSFGFGAEIERMYRSSYHLGMGDTGVAFAQGADAVFYNPAGIAQSKLLVSEISVLSPQVEVSRDSQNIYQRVQNGEDALAVAAGAKGKQQFASVQNYTGVVFQRAAMGVFQRAKLDAFVGSDPLNGLPRAELGASVYAGGHISYARPFAESFFLGLDVKVVQKASSHVKMNALEAQSLSQEDPEKYLKGIVKRGTGVGADIGFIYKTDSKTSFAVGAVGRNLGLTYYWPVEPDSPVPDPEPSVIDVGISIEPQTRKSRSRISADFRDVLDEQKENIFKRLHLGAELCFQERLGGTVGLNQGYLTYGGYLKIWVLRAEAGVYSEEFGEFPGNRQSKRAYGRLSVGWFQ